MSINMANMLHLSMLSQCKLHHIHVPCRAHDVLPVCSTSMWPCVMYLVDCFTVPVLCMCLYFRCVIFRDLKSQSHPDDSYVRDLKSQSHPDDSYVHATAPCWHVFTQACPTMSCIPLVLLARVYHDGTFESPSTMSKGVASIKSW